MTQSGGTVTANGIQFGGNAGTYDAASPATLQLSGGSLYVGARWNHPWLRGSVPSRSPSSSRAGRSVPRLPGHPRWT